MHKLIKIHSKEHPFKYAIQRGSGATPYQYKKLILSKKSIAQNIDAFLYEGPAYIGSAGYLNIYSTVPGSLKYYVKSNSSLLHSAEESEDATVWIPINMPGTEGIYGHYLIDTLCRYEFAKNLLPESPLGILVTTAEPDWVINMIKCLFGANVALKSVEKEEISLNKLLLISGFRQHDYLSSITVSLSKFRLKSKSDRRELKVFIPRNDSQARVLLNAAEVTQLFRKNGYKIVCPEKLSFQEQLEMFSQVHTLAGEAGSALHNSIFLDPSAQIINIQSSRQSHFIQAGLCAHLNQEIHYVWGDSITEDWSSDFQVDLDVLSETIQKLENRGGDADI